MQCCLPANHAPEYLFASTLREVLWAYEHMFMAPD